MAADVGSLQWVLRTDGRLSMADRWHLVAGVGPALRDGFRLRRFAHRKTASLERFEPPDTPMVRAAREHLSTHSHPSMIHHSYRTAFWTLAVLDLVGQVTEQDLETVWVAALLHDVGLGVPPARGDFTLGGVQVVSDLAAQLGWSPQQKEQAGEAIAINLSTHVSQAGTVAWAMNVGGLGELGFPLHRSLMATPQVTELESRYPRLDFRQTAMRLIRAEACRVPGGRFAFLGPIFPLIMKA